MSNCDERKTFPYCLDIRYNIRIVNLYVDSLADEHNLDHAVFETDVPPLYPQFLTGFHLEKEPGYQELSQRILRYRP